MKRAVHSGMLVNIHKRLSWGGVPIYSVCLFPSCKHSCLGQCQAPNVNSVQQRRLAQWHTVIEDLHLTDPLTQIIARAGTTVSCRQITKRR